MNEEDVNETNHLNSLDKTINDRGYFERLMREREKFDAERDVRLNERFLAQEKAIDKAERRLDDNLRGFPENYIGTELHAKDIAALSEDIDRVGLAIARLDREALSRERYDEAHKSLEDQVRKIDRDKLSSEKFESNLHQEQVSRELALQRVDEKFEDYVKRYEVRQREIDLLLAAQKGAADQAIKAAEETGRKANRNLGIASLVLGVVVFAANIIPVLYHG